MKRLPKIGSRVAVSLLRRVLAQHSLSRRTYKGVVVRFERSWGVARVVVKLKNRVVTLPLEKVEVIR